tara:strand:- start:671 stop:2764 length:2094 start_codon:yes stop_codon:yes gene_type:complete
MKRISLVIKSKLTLLIVIYSILLHFDNKAFTDENITIIADEIFVDRTNEKIEAHGNAIAKDEKGQIIKSDHITYEKLNTKIISSGNVIINDKDNNTYFASEIISIDGIENIEGISAKVRMSDGSRAVGSNIIKNNDMTVITNAEYTPCNEEEYLIKNCPGWKLKSKKIYQNHKTRTIHYDHAKIELFNIPVFYIPYFSHPDPSVKKKSGLLMPTVETDSQLGDIFSLPVFYNIKNNKDLTFTPTVQTEANNFYSFNYRHINNLGNFNINTSIDDNDDNSGTSSHFFLNSQLFNSYGSLDLNIQSSNNDTYMRKNKINKLTVLNSGLNFKRRTENTYFSINSNAYKHLTIQNGEQWEYVYPKIVYNINNINNLYGGKVSLNNEAMIKKDLNDSNTSIISSQLNWKKKIIHNNSGLLFDNESNLRVVSVNIDSKNQSDEENIRFFPQWSSKISFPLIKFSEETSYTFSPILMPVIAPYNNYTGQQTISNSNLFSSNRASSISEWESGPRINYGLELFMNQKSNADISLALGQSYRLNKNKEDTAEELSDYFLSSGLSLNNNFLNTSFVIDRKDIDIKSINLNSYNQINKFKLAIDYDYTSGKYTTPEEQIAIGGEYKLARYFKFKFTGSKNLDTNKNIGYQYGLLYENDCLGIDLNYYRDLTSDRDISESDGFSFTIVLKPFGSTNNYGKVKTFGPLIK